MESANKWVGESSAMIIRGIPKDLRKAFKSAAVDNDETMTQALRGLMADYIKRTLGKGTKK